MGNEYIIIKDKYDKDDNPNDILTKEYFNIKEKLKNILIESNRLEQIFNETAESCRISGIVLETRPDKVNSKTIQNYRIMGVTHLQLGIQSVHNDILKYVNRGHNVEESIRAVDESKQAGFKIHGHFMPDLPKPEYVNGKLVDNKENWNLENSNFEQFFLSSDFQVDYVKFILVLTCLLLKLKNGLILDNGFH